MTRLLAPTVPTEPTQFSSIEQETAVELAIQKMWALVCERVDSFRAVNGMTMEQFGCRIGAKKSQVHYWLSGPTNMTMRTAARLLLAAEADFEPHATPWEDIRAEGAFRAFSPQEDISFPISVSLDYLKSDALNEVTVAQFLRAVQPIFNQKMADDILFMRQDLPQLHEVVEPKRPLAGLAILKNEDWHQDASDGELISNSVFSKVDLINE